MTQCARCGAVALLLLLPACGGSGITPSLGPSLRPSASVSLAVSGSPSPSGAAVVVVAGTGERGWSGDGGPATKAMLNYTVGMAFAPDGSLVFADAEANVVRRIDPSGTIETIAGSGAPGFGGDGGLASAAQLSSPDDIAIGGDGTIYVGDALNNRVRRIDPGGMITTIAGTGAADDTGDGGLAASASINAPDGLAIAADGTLYVSTPGRVRRIDADGVITTIAGTGDTAWDPAADGGPATAASFADASSMEIGRDGSLYLADFLDCRILRMRPDGTLHSVAGIGCDTFEGVTSGDGGPATAAGLARPADIAIASNGDLLVLEHWGSLRRIDATGTIATVPVAWQWKQPLGMAVWGSELYVGDREHHEIVRLRLA